MERRRFLKNCMIGVAGSWAGLGFFSKAFGYEADGLRPKIAIIIDDIGFNRKRVKPFFKIRVPITFSVLPRLVHSRDLAREAVELGQEVMLHQPMEPYNHYYDPGPGALYTGFSPERIQEIMEENLYDVPYANGINNHMGSLFTARARDIYWAIRFVGKRSLFFVDSLTSSRSIAFKTARVLDVTTAKRTLFLDNDPDFKSVYSCLIELKRHARVTGRAIGIGHPFPQTADAISAFLKDMNHDDVSFVHISDILYS